MMTTRFEALTTHAVAAPAAQILDAVGRGLGMVPNLHRTLAHAPAALQGYVAMAEALGGGVLDRRLREKIALTVAGANGCGYCAAAHTTLGKNQKIEADELERNLRGVSSEPRDQAALRLVSALLADRGRVSDEALAEARGAGFSDAELVEIVAHVGMNVFTNTFNEFARTEIDFPEVALVG